MTKALQLIMCIVLRTEAQMQETSDALKTLGHLNLRIICKNLKEKSKQRKMCVLKYTTDLLRVEGG